MWDSVDTERLFTDLNSLPSFLPRFIQCLLHECQTPCKGWRPALRKLQMIPSSPRGAFSPTNMQGIWGDRLCDRKVETVMGLRVQHGNTATPLAILNTSGGETCRNGRSRTASPAHSCAHPSSLRPALKGSWERYPPPDARRTRASRFPAHRPC